MSFGMTGRLSVAGCLTLLLLIPVAGLGQDDPVTESCELPLVVPAAEAVELVLSPTVRGPGVLLTWAEPDDASTTCIVLTDTLDLGIPMDLTGAYADDFDRTLVFSFNQSGSVGATDANRFVLIWNNANQTQTGRIGGEINLSNTGGLWVRDNAGDWRQRNDGLPRYLPYTNLVDMAASSDGTVVMALSRGAQIQTSPEGVFRALPGGDWLEVAPEQFGRIRNVAAVASHPTDANRFAVGTQNAGLFVTDDGGATFTQWTSNLDPGFDSIPSSFIVSALSWSANRILVAVRNYGSFVSTDNGTSFSRFEDFEAPDGSIPYVRTFAEDSSDADRILAGLAGFGVWESIDAGATWVARNDTTAANSTENATVLTIETDPADSDALVMGTSSRGILYTTDRGENWVVATTPFDPLAIPTVWDLTWHDGVLLALANDNNEYGLLESVDGGQTWVEDATQPFNRRGRRLVSTTEGLLRPTTGGGIFIPGTLVPVSASRTTSATDLEYLDLDFAIDLQIDAGSVSLEDADGDGALDPRTFNAILQDYQGWVVWRSDRSDPEAMAMVGRYDKNNPETCIEGFCGDDSFVQLPNCYAERRAACFEFTDDGHVSFYDGDVYNGFTYLYSVTTFDYGDISLVVNPVALASPMVFPNRYPDDEFGIGDGQGNRQPFEINNAATAAVDGDEIYVFPNPLRNEAGIAGSEGEEVIWTNLPPDSKIDVFTLAGDLIVTLPEEDAPQEGGNVYWITRNDADELLASGVYLWRVVMPERGDFWGKLVIIR